MKGPQSPWVALTHAFHLVYIVLIHHMFFSIRFIEDAKGMLAGLEASFEKLAEVAHHIDMKQLTVEELLFFLACLYFKKRALTKV